VSDDDRKGPQPGHPEVVPGLEARLSDWDPVRGLHPLPGRALDSMAREGGQRSHVLRQQVGQMTATCNEQQQLKLTRAKMEPSTNDTTIRRN